jgi:hypothetical protein
MYVSDFAPSFLIDLRIPWKVQDVPVRTAFYRDQRFANAEAEAKLVDPRK